MIKKPPHGSPCNGCGLCCANQRCPLGQKVFGSGKRCPALEVSLLYFKCGLVENPNKYAPNVVRKHGVKAAKEAAATLIGAGLGCDAVTETEPYNNQWAIRTFLKLKSLDTTKQMLVWQEI